MPFLPTQVSPIKPNPLTDEMLQYHAKYAMPPRKIGTKELSAQQRQDWAKQEWDTFSALASKFSTSPAYQNLKPNQKESVLGRLISTSHTMTSKMLLPRWGMNPALETFERKWVPQENQ